jgi:hypothetical protein
VQKRAGIAGRFFALYLGGIKAAVLSREQRLFFVNALRAKGPEKEGRGR